MSSMPTPLFAQILNTINHSHQTIGRLGGGDASRRRNRRRAALGGRRGSVFQWREVRTDRHLKAPRWPLLTLQPAFLILGAETATHPRTCVLLAVCFFARAARHLENLHNPQQSYVVA